MKALPQGFRMLQGKLYNISKMVNYEDMCTSALNLQFMNAYSSFTEPNLIWASAYVVGGLIVSLITCFSKNSFKWHSAIFYVPWKCCNIDKMSDSLGMMITINFAKTIIKVTLKR